MIFQDILLQEKNKCSKKEKTTVPIATGTLRLPVSTTSLTIKQNLDNYKLQQCLNAYRRSF